MIPINPSIVMTMTTSNSPASHHLILTLELKDGEVLKAKASDLVSRKNVEYLVVEDAGATRELRLDKIASFSHPEIGTVVVSES